MTEPLLVFLSSMIGEFFDERKQLEKTIKSITLNRPWVFEYSGASSSALEASYLDKVKVSDIFIMLVGKDISLPVIKEYELAKDKDVPRLIFIKEGNRTQEAQEFIDSIDVKWTSFTDTADLKRQIKTGLINELITKYRRFKNLDISNLSSPTQSPPATPVPQDVMTFNITTHSGDVTAGKNIQKTKIVTTNSPGSGSRLANILSLFSRIVCTIGALISISSFIYKKNLITLSLNINQQISDFLLGGILFLIGVVLIFVLRSRSSSQPKRK